MSQILFKAKRLDTKEWVEGLPSYNCYDGEITEIERCNGIFEEVDPETVCEYIGILDKNGKKIFEGDIIRREMGDGKYKVGEVIRDIAVTCGFWFKHNNDLYPLPLFANEVIGNIFDNPELLEEG